MNCTEKWTSGFTPEWCPGCGNFDTLDCFRQAVCELEINPREIILVVGIGQASKLGFSVKCNFFNGLHGRALPIALGIKMANHQAKVVAVSGDGCFYAEGGNHFVHNLRRNLDVTILASDNRVYGLTKGQASPTSPADFITKLQIEGTGAAPIRPTMLALASGATFVAKAFTGDKEQLTDLIKQGIKHRGAALIDIMSPCVSFNKVNTFKWYKDRARPIGSEHDPTDFQTALKLAMHSEDEIATGVYYRVERPVFGDHMRALKGETIVARTLNYTPSRVQPLFESYK